MGVNWTARYSGLDEADVARMADADTRIHWLGRNPLLLNEATIFENAPGTNPPGPAGPGCTSPLEDADTTAPTAPGSFTAVRERLTNQVNLNWQRSTDDWSVAGYRIYLDGVNIANTDRLTFSHVVTAAPGPHTYAVAAFDTASPLGAGATIIEQIGAGFGKLYGNLSALSNVDTLTQPDITAPSIPTNLVSVVGLSSADLVVDLAWSPSVDDMAVASYGIYRDGILIDAVSAPATIYTDNGPLTPGVNYVYTVDAVDAQGNRSLKSAGSTANVTYVDADGQPTIVPGSLDTTPPTIPSNVLAINSPDIHSTSVNLSWTASTDNIGVTGYGIYRKKVLLPDTDIPVLVTSVNSATLSFTDANLPAATYSYSVDAFDSRNNRSVKSTASTVVVANDPPIAPHSLIAFPARDFISGTGYTPGASYHFDLIRGAQTYTSLSFAANPAGLIEVNHPGGTCWTVNTPDMRPGDVIRITDDATGIADQTTVANVAADRPIALNANTVVIHGTAQDASGQPLPIAEIEQRLIVGGKALSNGTRLLRTGVDGTLVYDAPGSINWTATYTGLTPTDVFILVGGTDSTGTVNAGAESRIHWLGRHPLALTEATIFENGTGVVGGPSAPCTAPAETPVAAASFAPASLSLGNSAFLPVPLSTTPPKTVTFSNGGGIPMTITNIYFAGHDPSAFQRSAGGTCPTLFPATLGIGASCTVNVTFKPTKLGLHEANLSFSDNAANTTDQTIKLDGSGFDNRGPSIGLSATTLSFDTVNGGAAAVNRVLTVTNTGADLTGVALTITGLQITGASAADFTVTGNTCGALLPGTVSCNITVAFKPGARGARTATLTLNHNKAPLATSTAITLSGTGGTASVLSLNSGKTVTFGTVNRNTSKNQAVTVQNNGNTATTLSLASFTVTGTGYSKVSTTCGNLAVRGTCNVVVRFTAPNTVGAFNGTITATAANALPVITAPVSLTATTK